MTALARYQAIAQDDAGNIVPVPTVEVRRESDNALVSLFSDRVGTVAIGNPFSGASDGSFGFHVGSGTYKITVTKSGLSRIFRYVAIGTIDGDEVYFPGNIFAFGLTPPLPNAGILYNGVIVPSASEAACLQLSPGFTPVNSGSIYSIAIAAAMQAGSANCTSYIGIRSELFYTNGNTFQNVIGLLLDQQTGGISNRSLVVATGGISEFRGEVRIDGDGVGQANANTFTGVSNVAANSTGVGSIKFKGTTSRDSSGFIKILIGTTPYYIPVFPAITG